MSDKPRRKTAAQPPVSAHPAFPVIVTVWFAALFGIGSLVLPISLFERLALASGLADMLAAAQPPLGATARIAVALLAAVIGAGAGLFVARRIAAAQMERPVARTVAATHHDNQADDSGAKRPISAHEELGAGGFDAQEPDSAPEFLRSRRSVATPDESKFLASAPLPGRSDADEPLDLMEFDALAEPADLAEDEASLTQAESGASNSHSAPDDSAPPVAIAARPLSDLGVVELVERFAHALERHKAEAQRLGTEPTVPAALRPFAFDTDEGESDLPDLDLTSALSHGRGDSTAPLVGLAEESDEEEDAADYPSLLAMKSPFGLTREPVRIDDEQTTDAGTDPVALFPGQSARDPFASATPTRASDAQVDRATPPRSAPRAGDTERALRDALEKLQRLSGAA